ncbi:MAG: lipopolysaccharide heptosyltransferase II [Phycisphaeraceae bacterium]|nr:lipopolysaccharide heptosyltransferase II [Phycisphaeraceae bacterium]
MSADDFKMNPQRLLVVLPTWLGDTVMATPTLRALRGLYPQTHISVLVRRENRPILASCPWVDRILTVRRGTRNVPGKRSQPGGAARQVRRGRPTNRTETFFGLTRRLAAGNFDAAILLPNSFRTALMVRMAGVERRIGYARDGRGGLLTDKLLPRRRRGGFVPVPTVEYYLGIAQYLGAVDTDVRMALFTHPEDDRQAAAILDKAGVGADRPLLLINPGASYGDAKLWPAERFAAVAEQCAAAYGAAVAVSGAPRERAILDKVMAAAHCSIIDLPRLGVDLRLLKSVVKRASVMVTNDTGPRHMAAALGVPVVTVFGPTDPAWTEIGFEQERQVRRAVYCGPCQQRQCPLRHTPEEHQCMRLIEPGEVVEQVAAVWRQVPVPA